MYVIEGQESLDLRAALLAHPSWDEYGNEDGEYQPWSDEEYVMVHAGHIDPTDLPEVLRRRLELLEQAKTDNFSLTLGRKRVATGDGRDRWEDSGLASALVMLSREGAVDLERGAIIAGRWLTATYVISAHEVSSEERIPPVTQVVLDVEDETEFMRATLAAGSQALNQHAPINPLTGEHDRDLLTDQDIMKIAYSDPEQLVAADTEQQVNAGMAELNILTNPLTVEEIVALSGLVAGAHERYMS